MPEFLRESDLQAAGARWLRKQGATVTKQATYTGYGRSGDPDVLVEWGPPHRAWRIEWKMPGKRPTELQQRRIDHFRALGCPVDVLDNLDDLKRRWEELHAS